MRKPKRKSTVPEGLRKWFIAHFIMDLLFGLPLMAAPNLVMPIFGWQAIDPLTARLVGAALLAIGSESFFMRDAGPAVYRSMLSLKIVWASAACMGILLSLLLDNSPVSGWGFLGIFLIFDAVWIYYRQNLE